MDQVFNELSLSASLVDVYVAHSAVMDLKKASDKLCQLGFSSQIRVTEDFAIRYISPNCTIRDYLRSPASGQDKTIRQWLLSRFSRAPYVEQLCKEYNISEELEEYKVGEEPCKGLALAGLWRIPALSLSGDPRFVSPAVSVTHIYFADIESGEDLLEDSFQVGIICKECDIDIHAVSIQDILHAPLRDGKSLLDYAKQQLTFLAFSTKSEEQLAGLKQGNLWLPRIYAILVELNRAMQESLERKSIFVPQGFKYTPGESESATQGKKGKAHTFVFRNPGMQESSEPFSLMCEAHMRISDGDRVYFCPSITQGKVYIGHIGEHLPTKAYG